MKGQTVDYPLIKLLYIAHKLSIKEIAKELEESPYTIELAVFSDMKLGPKDQRDYARSTMEEKLQILEIERLSAFSVRYAKIESSMIRHVERLLRDSDLDANGLRAVASALSLVRKPLELNRAAGRQDSSGGIVDCEALARQATLRLEELRAKRAQ